MKNLLFAFLLSSSFIPSFAQKIIKLDFKTKEISPLTEIEKMNLGEIYKIEKAKKLAKKSYMC